MTTTTKPALIEGAKALSDAVMRERYVKHVPHPVLVCAPDRAGVYELRNWIGARTLGTSVDPGICSPAELYFSIARFAGAKGYAPLRWAADIESFGRFVDALIDQHPLERSLHLRIGKGLGALIGEGTQGPASVEAWLAISCYRAWFVDYRLRSDWLGTKVTDVAQQSGVALYTFRLDQGR